MTHATRSPSVPAGPALLLAPGPDAASELARAVEDRLPRARTVQVTPGPVLRVRDDQATVPRDGDDLAALVDAFNEPVGAVVYAWPGTAAPPGLRDDFPAGLRPLAGLVRALVARRAPVRLLCAVPDSPPEDADQQALAVLLRTAHRESEWFAWRLLRLPPAILAAFEQDGSAADVIGSALAGCWDCAPDIRYVVETGPSGPDTAATSLHRSVHCDCLRT